MIFELRVKVKVCGLNISQRSSLEHIVRFNRYTWSHMTTGYSYVPGCTYLTAMFTSTGSLVMHNLCLNRVSRSDNLSQSQSSFLRSFHVRRESTKAVADQGIFISAVSVKETDIGHTICLSSEWTSRQGGDKTLRLGVVDLRLVLMLESVELTPKNARQTNIDKIPTVASWFGVNSRAGGNKYLPLLS